MITCKICSETFKTITASHLVTHKISVLNYKRKFRLKYIHSRNARRKISLSKIGNQNTKGKQIQMNFNSRQKQISAVRVFNKKKSTRILRSKQMKGNKFAIGLKHSKTFKHRLSKRIKQLWQNPIWRKKMLITRMNRQHQWHRK